MSTVCYCGQPDCPVTTWERDACVANLRAERDALKAQVEAARKVCVSKHRGNGATLDEWNMAVDILHAMKAAK